MAETTAEAVQTEPSQTSDEVAALRSEMEQMKRELAAARSERQTEADGRVQAEKRVLSAEEKRIQAEETTCKAVIDGLNSEADAIEADIARLADEPGHGAEIAKLNRRLAQVTTKVNTEEQRQAWLAQQRERAKAEAQAPADTGRKLVNGTPLSQFAPKVREWFEAHPKVFTDQRYLDKAIAAAGYAQNVEGFAEQSDEYFAYVEQVLGERQAAQPRPAADGDEGEELTPEVRNPQRPAAGPGSMRAAMAAVAPPSRTAATPAGTSPRRQKLLSIEEREVADHLYGHIAPKDRYQHYAEMQQFMKDRKPSAFGAN